MKSTLLIFASFIIPTCSAQVLVSNREKIEKAQTELIPALDKFSSSLLTSNLTESIEELLKNATDEYRTYLIGGVLYSIDPVRSFKLHQEAYSANTNELNFILEHAIELHRIGRFKDASILFEKYLSKNPTDFRIFVWLSECYLNMGDIKKSIDSWSKADHAHNHTGIDMAIYTVHDEGNELKKRDDYKSAIAKGDHSKFYPLIFIDKNWEMDWWNKGEQSLFLQHDMALAKKTLGVNNDDYRILHGYVRIKALETRMGGADSIKQILTDLKLILNNNPLPPEGQIASDLLSVCFNNGLLATDEFYLKRGEEILALAKKTKDKDILNIYAFLQATVDGKVKPEIDKMGWREFKDERFAISYFIGKKEDNRFDDPDLNQALQDFPNSAKLFWYKAKTAREEKKDPNKHLIELIKREFKSLASDQSRYSYLLRNYFTFLKN
jgi:hypothetical protein